MIPHRIKLFNILTQLDQADAATTKLLKLDVGPATDALAEHLAKTIEAMRAIVTELLSD